MRMKKTISRVIGVMLALVLLATLGGYLVYRGVISPNHLLASRYPVQGVDVSHYQGTIDWSLLERQNVSFAFIKATEGRDFTDPQFQANLEQARKTGIRIGAYHYFTFTSSGEEQAWHYMAVVPRFDGMLPPVVDLEMDAAKRKNMLDRETVVQELSTLLQRLETHYGIKPVIYATASAYEEYVRGRLDGYGLWIRSVYFSPLLYGVRGWTFWQYSDEGQLQGYSGPETSIDLNVFAGSAEQFQAYPAQQP